MESGRIVLPQGKLLRVGIAGAVCLLSFLLVGSLLYAAERDAARISRVFNLKNLKSEQVREHLQALNIGTRVDALNDRVVLVTTDVPSDLTRASSLVEMLDAKEARVLRQWEPSGEIGFPSPQQIAASLKDVTVGTFLDSPGTSARNPLLMDTRGDRFVAIGDPELVEKVGAKIDAWQKAQANEREAARLKSLSLAELATELMPEAKEKELTAPAPEAPAAEEAAPETPAAVEEPQPVTEVVETPVTETPTEEPAEMEPVTEVTEVPVTETTDEPAVEAADVPTEVLAEKAEELAKSENDFFTQELLQALASEEKKAADLEKKIEATEQQIETTESLEAAVPVIPEEPSVAQEAAPVTAPAEETPAASQEDEGDKILQEFLQSLRQQNTPVAEQSEVPVTEPEQPVVEAALPTAETGETAAATGDLVRLESQLADAQKQIAELKELLMARLEAKEAAAVDPYKAIRTMSEPEIPEGEELIVTTLTLPQTVELTQLLDLVGKQLGLNFMYDPAQVKGNVQLMLYDGKVKVRDTYALLESVMRFRGFVMTRRGSWVTIVPQAQFTQIDPEIVGPGEPIKPGDVLISSVFQLENITPQTAQIMLQQMNMGMPNGFVPVAETGSLIVTDYAYRMDRIQKVIRMVDVPGEPKEFKSRVVEYMQAGEMVGKLQALTAQMEGVSIAGGSAAPGTPAAPQAGQPQVIRDRNGRVIRAIPAQPGAAPAPAGAAVPAGNAIAEQQTVFLETDDRTNRILMIGYPDQIKMINELIETLDVPGYNLRYVKEYVIENVEASEIINSLNELGLAQVSTSSDSGASSMSARSRTMPQRPGQPVQPGQPGQPAMMQPMASTGGGSDQPYISIRPNTNSLLVNATKEQHEAIELVIVHVDVEQKDQRRIEEYEIQNVGASDVVATLESLGIIPSGSTVDSGSSRTDSRNARSMPQRGAMPVQPGQPQEAGPVYLPTAEGETVKELTGGYPQVAVLESTNSLLVNATPRQHGAIALVIAHVDRTLEEVSTPYVVYPLENQAPEDLVLVLNELLAETLEKAQAGGSTGDAKLTVGAPVAAAAPMREEERIEIVADKASYSLIVYANKKNQVWIRDLIRELDEYRPQVLLDCTLVEITKQDDFSYDLNILASIPDLTSTSGTTDALKTSGGAAFPFSRQTILEKLTAAPDRNKFIDFGVQAGEFTGFFGNEKIMALFEAMQTKEYGRILAKPKLLVDDNQEGKIETKTTTYIEKKTINYIQGSEPGSQTPVEQIDFEPYDATILLAIKPHISKGDNLRLEVELTRTDFLNLSSTGTKPPNQATSNVNSVVTLPDGSTVILGGLDKIQQEKGGTKVPILGDIPLIGGLFRSTANTSQHNKLYVFVKANILRPGTDMTSEDLRRISSKYRAEFEEQEGEMQRYEDWPGIEPKPMEPANVLELDD